MVTTKVLAMLELLQTHGQLSGAELARRLDVHPRTVRRYVAVLEELGIPLVAERGRNGAYGLVAGFKLPPMMFTDDEALALALARPARRARPRPRRRRACGGQRAGEARARHAADREAPRPRR